MATAFVPTGADVSTHAVYSESFFRTQVQITPTISSSRYDAHGALVTPDVTFVIAPSSGSTCRIDFYPGSYDAQQTIDGKNIVLPSFRDASPALLITVPSEQVKRMSTLTCSVPAPLHRTYSQRKLVITGSPNFGIPTLQGLHSSSSDSFELSSDDVHDVTVDGRLVDPSTSADPYEVAMTSTAAKLHILAWSSYAAERLYNLLFFLAGALAGAGVPYVLDGLRSLASGDAGS